MSHLLNKVQDEMVDEKTFIKKSMDIILVPNQRYQDSRHLLKNPKVPRSVMGFSNRTQRFTGSNYLDVDSPLSNSFLNKPAAQAAGANPSQCSSTNRKNSPHQ